MCKSVMGQKLQEHPKSQPMVPKCAAKCVGIRTKAEERGCEATQSCQISPCFNLQHVLTAFQNEWGKSQQQAGDEAPEELRVWQHQESRGEPQLCVPRAHVFG